MEGSDGKDLHDQGIRCPHHNTIELQWLEHLWNHGHLFEICVVRTTEE